jgi:AraC-like DNA-binding protein
MAAETSRVSTQILLHVVDQLTQRGVNPAGLLAEAGIDRAWLSDIDRMVALRTYVRFFERAAEALGDVHFGLHAADAEDAGALGALSFLFMSAPTLREAFASFVQYLNVMQEGTLMELRRAANHIHFVYQLRDSQITPRRQDTEYSIATIFSLVNQYIPRQFVPLEIYFEHDRLGAYETYRQYFGCEVYFGQPTNAIVFDPGILDTRSPRLSARLYPIISAHLQAAMTHRARPVRLSDRVGLALTDEVLSRAVTMAEIAERLNLSASSLARRLAREQLTFRDVLGRRRMESAARLLLESEARIGEIALRVGYGENASFTRAFRARTGLTPGQYRARGAAEGGDQKR